MNFSCPQKKAIFLDRDGTIIVDKVYLNDPDGIEYIPGVFEALRQLRDAGYVFLVATNQSGVPRGLVSLENLHEIHRRISFAFAAHGVDILAFYYAPYLTDHNHIYRKPNPGMLLQGAHEFSIDLGSSWMIGDKIVDVEAGHRAGARSILLHPHPETWNGQQNQGPDDRAQEFLPPEGVFRSIAEAVPFIIGADRSGGAK